jgi:uncharacterized protein YegP (UPF0339 family)
MATFEIYRDNDTREWRWRLRADDDTVIAIGAREFRAKQSAEEAIADVIVQTSDANVVERVPSPTSQG